MGGDMDETRDLGVALSGGGHRATVFALGSLLALADLGLHRRTASISSVSGGSIANGIVMVGPDFGASDESAIEAHMAPALHSIADRGILLGKAPATRRYLATLIGALVVAVVGVVVALVALVGHWWLVALVAAVVGLAAGWLTWRLAGERSARVEGAIDRELLTPGTTLGAPHVRGSSVHHVICTTELQSGHSFFFTNRAVYGYHFGGNRLPCNVPLARAVQASAAVPGAFGPRVVTLSELGLTGDGYVVLSDGGVYDNMADEWEYGMTNRRRNWPAVRETQPDRVRTLLVVNGSGGWNALKPIRRRRSALELAGLLRAKDVQYDVSTSHRRRALMAEFIDDDATGDSDGDSDSGLDGAFVQITASPYDAPRRFASRAGHEPDAFARRAQRAVEYLDGQGYTPEWWASTVVTTSGVGTTLAKLGRSTTAALLEHGYVLTLVNLHVILGIGDLDRPLDRSRFQRLAAGQTTPTSPAAS